MQGSEGTRHLASIVAMFSEDKTPSIHQDD